jgi:hypothetical protein
VTGVRGCVASEVEANLKRAPALEFVRALLDPWAAKAGTKAGTKGLRAVLRRHLGRWPLFVSVSLTCKQRIALKF